MKAIKVVAFYKESAVLEVLRNCNKGASEIYPVPGSLGARRHRLLASYCGYSTHQQQINATSKVRSY